jgi:hypothetical protein
MTGPSVDELEGLDRLVADLTPSPGVEIPYGPPSLDDDPDDIEERNIEYPDWTAATSFVISGPLPGGHGPGRMFYWDEAEWWVNVTYGTPIHKIEGTRGRWAYRVRKPGTPGGKYTPPADHKLPERARRR